MNDLQEILNYREELCKERDLCAELCNIWLTRMHQHQSNKVEYEKYLKMLNDSEPYTQSLKSEISMLNRKICEIEGVETISDTPYVHVCTSKYGFDHPNS
jgi:hypothetical protein